MRPDEPLDPLHRMVAVRGGSLATTDTGTGIPVVAVHGLPATSNDFRWLDAALAGRVRMLRLDLPGFGESPMREGPLGFDELAGIVAEFCEVMDLDDAVVLGHSLGGAVAVGAALLSPRIARVVLVNSSGPIHHRANFRRTYRVLLALADLHPVVRRSVMAVMVPVARQVGFSKRLSKDAMIEAARLAAHYPVDRVAEQLQQLDKPVLVARPTEDPAVEAAVTDALVAALSDVSVQRFDGKTHNLQSSHATELADAILDWLR